MTDTGAAVAEESGVGSPPTDRAEDMIDDSPLSSPRPDQADIRARAEVSAGIRLLDLDENMSEDANNGTPNQPPDRPARPGCRARGS